MKNYISPPGDTISETMEHYMISKERFAILMHLTDSQVERLLIGLEPITSDIAVRLEGVLGIDYHFWMNREKNYRDKLKKQLK